MSDTILYLVRHGQTPANLEGVWHGSTDTPLTDLGRRQADRTAAHIAKTRADATALYASPLQRAHHTAEPIAGALDLEIRLRDDLQEYDLGAWEGKSYRELNETDQLFQRMHQDPDWEPGGGESARQVAHRLGGALQDIAAAHVGERVIVVAHAGALTLAFGWLIDGDLGVWRTPMDNAAVSNLRMASPPELLVFNENQHLQDLEA